MYCVFYEFLSLSTNKIKKAKDKVNSEYHFCIDLSLFPSAQFHYVGISHYCVDTVNATYINLNFYHFSYAF